ncbi:TetR family transcriptional regulator [Streptacidiphilus monticola]
MARRKTHQASETSRQAILEAVLSRAVEAGYEGTTMADVARASGLPIGSVYWHFQNKEQLFVALLDYCFEVWKQTNTSTGGMRDLLRHSISQSAAASASLADPAAAFWSIGLVFAFERRLQDNLARQRYLAIREEMFQFVTSQLRASYPGFPSPSPPSSPTTWPSWDGRSPTASAWRRRQATTPTSPGTPTSPPTPSRPWSPPA